MSEKNFWQKFIKIITVILTILIFAFLLYAIKIGIFHDKMKLVSYIKSFGFFASFLFILIQALQVIFPIIPGGASCLAGVLAFGPIEGFIYNYIGLVIGSFIAFWLSRTYGIKIIKKLFKEETIEKYLKYIKNDKFNTIFFWGILLPGFPDDLLCYLAGISNISSRKMLLYTIIGKPFALFFYSLFFQIL